MARLVFVHHTVSPATHDLQLAALEGLRDPALEDVEVKVLPALSASVVDVLEGDGYLLGCPVNLGYLAGAMKHFFDTVYYPCLGVTAGRPFAVYLHANGDAARALRAIDAIAVAGLGWKAAQPPLVLTGSGPSEAAAVRELASSLAAWMTL